MTGTIFDHALDTMFADPNHTVEAVYTPPTGGAGTGFRLSWVEHGDRDWPGLGVGIAEGARVAEARVSEVALMEEHGTVTCGAESLRIVKAYRSKTDGRLWILELAEQ